MLVGNSTELVPRLGGASFEIGLIGSGIGYVPDSAVCSQPVISPARYEA